jgi:putative acetyltransferase
MITIESFQPHQQEAAKQVLLTVCQELWGVPPEVVIQHDPLTDLDDITGYYLNNNGLFLLLVDRGQVVGTGGVRHWQDRICELKRLWFLKEYRGQGFGWQMTQRLLDFAVRKGYERMRLEVADGEKQAAAIKLYQQAGFYLIERYSDGPGTVFMEKMLQGDPVRKAA